jgi:hypothetical protein
MSTIPMGGGPQPPTSSRSFPPMPMHSASPLPPPTQPMSEPHTLPLARAIPRPRKGPATVVVPRGPTNVQKMLAFLAMLVVVVAGGVSAVLYYEPSAFSFIHPRRSGSTFAPSPTSAPSAATKPRSH